MRDHDPGRRDGSTRMCIADTRYRVDSSSRAPRSFPRVQVQRINLDDRWSGLAALRLSILGDIANDSGCRENDSGRRIAQHRLTRSSWTPTIGTESGTAMSPGLQCAEKCNDVVEPLWRQYHSPVTSRPAKPEFLRNVERSPIHLRPRQAFGNAGPVLLVIDECERLSLGCRLARSRSTAGMEDSIMGVTLPVRLLVLACPRAPGRGSSLGEVA